MCAKVINKAVNVYMELFALPPVVEGHRHSSGTAGLSIRPGGIDLFKPFILTVHLSYCQNLNPEVEEGMVAFDKVYK